MKAKKIFTLAMAAVLTLALLAGCGAAAPAADPTAAPAADAPATEAPASEAPAALSGSVSTNGSTSMEKVVNILAEQFMNDNPGVSVTYDPTGSGTGIESARTGSCDIRSHRHGRRARRHRDHRQQGLPRGRSDH